MTPDRKPDQPNLLRRFASDEQAATSVEYVLIAVLLAVPLLGMLATMRDQLTAMLDNVAAAFAAALS